MTGNIFPSGRALLFLAALLIGMGACGEACISSCMSKYTIKVERR